MNLWLFPTALCLFSFSAQAQAARFTPDIVVSDLKWNCIFTIKCKGWLPCRDYKQKISIEHDHTEGGVTKVWFPRSKNNPNAEAEWAVLTKTRTNGFFNISGFKAAGIMHEEINYVISIFLEEQAAFTEHSQHLDKLLEETHYGSCQEVGA